MSWPTDEMVEAAAREAWRRDCSSDYDYDWPSNADQHRYRIEARAILAVGLATAPREWGVRTRPGDEWCASEATARQIATDLDGTVVSRSAPGPWEPAPSDEQEIQPLIDPDCQDPFKHTSCAGPPCECPCHTKES